MTICEARKKSPNAVSEPKRQFGGSPAILIEGLHKSFRLTQLKREYTTLKSALLRPFSRSGSGNRRLTVLGGLDLTVDRGSMIGVIGRNGSGKSTLLKILAGIYKADQGRVELSGRVASLIELGAGFHPEFSGRENIFLNGAILGLTKDQIRDRLETIIDFAELREFIDNPVRTYSSGMYVRLGFSVAVNVDPDILLVDEVLAVGDEAFAHKCDEKIGQFKRQGKTILLVTHDMSAVEKYCDRAVWLESGAIRAQGDPRRVIHDYRQFVAEREDESRQGHQAGDNPAASGTDRRWGDGSVELGRVEVADQAGQPRSVFGPGDGLTVTISYRLIKPLTDIVFGVALRRSSGELVLGTNTDIDRHDLTGLPDQGRIRFAIESQELTDGTYLVDAAAHAQDGRAYDYWTQCAEFSVRSDRGEAGVYRPPHRWQLLEPEEK